jgi:hypothetical protein
MADRPKVVQFARQPDTFVPCPAQVADAREFLRQVEAGELGSYLIVPLTAEGFMPVEGGEIDPLLMAGELLKLAAEYAAEAGEDYE